MLWQVSQILRPFFFTLHTATFCRLLGIKDYLPTKAILHQINSDNLL